ncbi:MAG: hypothetical protein IMZ70_01370 [Candidatus Atribacteria bacterium]|nr:hypothetical protein [Candidatus Atribacteria bacterium]
MEGRSIEQGNLDIVRITIESFVCAQALAVARKQGSNSRAVAQQQQRCPCTMRALCNSISAYVCVCYVCMYALCYDMIYALF